MNKAILGGIISSYGVRLSYSENAKPQLSFALTVMEGNYKTYVPVQIVGAQAEVLAETLEPGDFCLVEGKLSWKKDQGKLHVVAFGVERLSTERQEMTSPAGEDASDPDHGAVLTEAPGPVKKGKPRYPKWRPEQQN